MIQPKSINIQYHLYGKNHQYMYYNYSCYCKFIIKIKMDNEKEIDLMTILEKQERLVVQNKTRYNSRHSLSYNEELINIDDDQIDEQLEQFSQITYAIRISSSGYNPHQRISTNKPVEKHQELFSRSVQIEVQQDSPKMASSQKIVKVQHSIPQIRLSNMPKNITPTSQIITVMIILTSNKEIDKIKIFLNDSKENEELTSFKQRYTFKNIWVLICLINVPLDQYKNLTIKYKEVNKSFLMFSSKMDKQISLSQARVYQDIGLLFPELQEETPNVELTNFCIISAQQHLSRRIRHLCTINPSIINQFYYIFNQYFRPHESRISEAYAIFQPSKHNIYSTEFFLYFFYKSYREDSINKLHQFNLLSRLKIYRNCSKVLSTKYYQLFQNGQYFKDFLLYAYFLIATACGQKDFQLIKSITRYNILHQNSFQSSRILLKVQNLGQKYLAFINNKKVNEKIITNRQISFQKYMQLKLKGLKQMIKQEEKDIECDYKAISSLLVQLLTNLIQKIKCNRPHKDQNYHKFRQTIKAVFLNKGRLRVTNKDFAELYARIKFILKLSKNVGQIFLDVLRSPIFAFIPCLLVSYYDSIIHALILKPEIPEQNKILVDYFQNHLISTSQIIYLLRKWLEMKNQLYNYLTIQFIILKFMAVNCNFQKIELNDIMFTIAQFIREQPLSSKRKKEISLFCIKMNNQMQDHPSKQDFYEWQYQIVKDLS